MIRSHVVRVATVAAFMLGCSSGSGGGGGGGSGGNAGTTGAGGASTAGSTGTAGTSTGGAGGGGATGNAGAVGTAGDGGGSAGAAGGTAGGSAGNAGHGGSAGGTSGAAGGASGGSGGITGACNNLVNSAPIVNKDHDAGAPPAMTGGTIADGTYYLTKMVQYNGENGNTAHQETWVFSGNTIQVIELDGTRISGTYVASGHTLTLTITCPVSLAGMTVASPYTATPTQLVTINGDDPNEAHTYTLQSSTGAGGSGGASGCTNLSASGSVVTEVAGTGTAPSPAGGTINDGTYDLTSWVPYSPATASSSNMRQLSLRITAGHLEFAGTDANGAHIQASGTISTSGTSMSTTFNCGASGSNQQGYTATANQLVVFDPRSGGIVLETWTRQ